MIVELRQPKGPKVEPHTRKGKKRKPMDRFSHGYH